MNANNQTDQWKTTREHPVARKSTASSLATSRRQTSGGTNSRIFSKALRHSSDRFMENFDPETSLREKRKLSRKINPPVRRPPGAVCDENGIHISSGVDLCDCLAQQCPGCFFECSKCGSTKCGLECRVHRKHLVEQIEYHGYDIIKKNPFQKNL